MKDVYYPPRSELEIVWINLAPGGLLNHSTTTKAVVLMLTSPPLQSSLIVISSQIVSNTPTGQNV